MALANAIFSRWDGVSDRLPATLAGLRGPHTGIVVLSPRTRRACERRLGLAARS